MVKIDLAMATTSADDPTMPDPEYPTRLPEEERVALLLDGTVSAAELTRAIEGTTHPQAEVTTYADYDSVLEAVRRKRATLVVIATMADIKSFTALRELWAALSAIRGHLVVVTAAIDTRRFGAEEVMTALINWFASSFRARAAAGVAAARAAGAHTGRPRLPKRDITRLRNLLAKHGRHPRLIADMMGLSHSTVIAYADEFEAAERAQAEVKKTQGPIE